MTGPSEASHGILYVFDIFGFTSQTLQGADILAYSDRRRPYRVCVPDFFLGNPVDFSDVPSNSAEKKAKMDHFRQTVGDFRNALPRIEPVVASLRQSEKIDVWASIGFCWGGKVRRAVESRGP